MARLDSAANDPASRRPAAAAPEPLASKPCVRSSYGETAPRGPGHQAGAGSPLRDDGRVASRAASSGSTLRLGLFFLASDLIAAALVSWLLVALSAAALPVWPEGSLWPFAGLGVATGPEAPTQALTLAALLIGALSALGLYRPAHWEFGEGRRSLVAGLLICLSYTTLAVDGPFAGLAALGAAAAILFSLLVTLGRMVVRSFGLAQSAMRRKIVLVSQALTPDDLSRELRSSRGMRAEVVAAMTLDELMKVLHLPTRLQRRFFEGTYGVRLDELTFAFAPTAEEAPQLVGVVEALNAQGVAAIIAVSLPDLVGRRMRTMRVFGGDILFAQVEPDGPGRLELFLKRAVDVVGAAAALLLFSPLLVSIALALRLEGGSPFFSQTRVGKARRRFRCHKFRTMVPDAEARLQEYLRANPEAQREWDLHQKLKQDPRITRLGGFLRKTSLDELPQLWNVLRGDMSLVGPRPIIAPEVPGYSQDAAYYHSEAFEIYARCRPGITGVWQVSGRSKTTHEERVRLDCWYARNWTIWLDMMIILKTVRAAVFGSAWA